MLFRGFGKYSFQSYGKVSCLYDHHQNSFKNSDQNSQEKQIYQNIGFILQFQSLFRYRESDPKSRNWLVLPINPPDARKVKIHNLTPRTNNLKFMIGTGSQIMDLTFLASGGLIGNLSQFLDFGSGSRYLKSYSRP